MAAKKIKSPLLLTLGTTALLLIGGGVAYWYLSQPKAGPGDMPIGAEAVPPDALMAISLTTNPGQWEQLREFGTVQSQGAFDKNLAQVRDRLLTANGFNYQQDIQPWVGEEVTIAFLGTRVPFAAPPDAGNQQPVVVVLPMRDPLKAKQILEQPRTTASASKLVDRTYKGFQIKETQGRSAQNYSVTALGTKYLVVTNDPKATDQAIDSYTSGKNLTQIPDYQKALGQVKVDRPFGKIYVNLPAATAIQSANAGKPPASEQQVPQRQGFAATATLQPDGVQFKGVSWLKPDSKQLLNVQNNAKVMPSRLPADTMLMVSGGNLKQFWQDYRQGAASSPITPIDPNMLETGIQSTVGLNWNQDLLPWMDGEFSIALASAPEGSSPNLPFSLLFLVRASDRRAAETSLKKLDEAMVSRKLKVEESKVSGQPVITWTIPQSGVVVNRGWLDNNVAFLTLGAPIANTIVPRPSRSLADNEVFKKTVPTMNPNNGHFFINVEEAINSKRLLPPINNDLITAIRSIGVTAAVNDNRSSRYNVFVALHKTENKPAPLPSPSIPPASSAPGTTAP